MRWFNLILIGICVLRIWYMYVFSVPVDEKNLIDYDFMIRTSPQIKFDDYRNTEYQLIWFEYNTDKIGVKLERWPEVNLGDRVRILNLGQMKLLNEGERLSFDRRVWMIDNSIVDINNGQGIWRILNYVRQHLLSLYRKSFTYTNAGVLSAMVIGDKRGLSKEFEDKLRWAGLSHVVVVSGFNIMLIFTYVSGLLMCVASRPKSLVVGMVFIWLFVFLVGIEAPVLRAAIFLTIISVGYLYGRVVDMGRVLFITVIIMLLISPILIVDVSWQLSVAATAGLILFARKIYDWLVNIETKQKGILKYVFGLSLINEALSTSIAAMFVVLPVLIWHFGTLSFVTLFSNILVLWLIPFITTTGLIFGLLGLISNSIAFILIHILQAPLLFFKITVDILGQEAFAPDISLGGRFGILIIWIILFLVTNFKFKKL